MLLLLLSSREQRGLLQLQRVLHDIDGRQGTVSPVAGRRRKLIDLGRPGVVIDAGVDRRLLGVGRWLAADDDAAAAAGTGRAEAREAREAADTGELGVRARGRGQRRGPRQAQLRVRHLAAQLRTDSTSKGR